MSEIYGELRKAIQELAKAKLIDSRYESKIFKKVSEAYKQQMRERYVYLVGKWRGKLRAKSAKSGSYVKLKKVLLELIQNI